MGDPVHPIQQPNPGDNGLRTFAVHAGDAARAPVFATPEAGAGGPDDFAGQGVAASALDPETVARHYLAEALASADMPAFALAPAVATETDFKPLGTETILLTGATAVKFRQYLHTIPIYGSLVTVELDEQNELLAISAATAEPLDVDPVASLAPAQALDIAREQAGDVEQPGAPQPRLYYYFDRSTSQWRLVYIIEDMLAAPLEAADDDLALLPELFDYVIDAHTGEVVAELPRTQTAVAVEVTALDGIGDSRQIRVLDDGQGTRIMHDPSYNVWTHNFNFADAHALPNQLPGDSVSNPPDPWNPAAVSAHANAVAVAAFLKDVLRRNGLDNAGGPIVSSINCVYRVSGTREWRNAAWLPGRRQMIYGQRQVNGALRSYAVAGDIVAHEILHGLTEATARLEYLAMSGALNESYSDIFGIIISNRAQPDIGQWNWELGEDLNGTGLPLRDLRDPGRHNQPAHMDDYRNLPLTRAGDWGGVHVNSGIHNKAAHTLLISRDAQGQFMFDATSVAALFYLALTQHLSRTSVFADSRRGVTLAAGTLFRNDPSRNARQEAIARAFDAVGIS